jgi:flavin reductase (DIM6/NTAB) family NADH-FMN oxidoreductase RutF
MDEQAKKTALRMIPYGLYVLGTKQGDELGAAAINWLTQASFEPPLLAMGVKTEGATFQHLRANVDFALSILGTGQKDMAFAFFKPTEQDGDSLNGYKFETKETGAPILVDAPAWVEGRVTDVVERGDHAVVVAEVTGAGVRKETTALTLVECGVNYGG